MQINTASDWTLSNPVDGSGNLVKEGVGRLNIGDEIHHTGLTDINDGALIVGEHRGLGGENADDVNVKAGAILAGLGTVNGRVNNAGIVSVLNGITGYENISSGTFTLANGLINSGTANVATPPGKTPGNTLLVQGDYTGMDGKLVLRTVMGDDNSATDKLVIDGGTASGHTGLVIKTAGGEGEKTHQGIRVVETLNGASTAIQAFTLDKSSDGYRHVTGTVAAGAYDYYLIRGGAGGVQDDWYLVNITGALPDPLPEKSPAVASGDKGSPSPYRPEVGAYLNNRLAALAMPVHTLHERQGQAPGMQGKNLEESSDASTWIRTLGATSKRNGAGGMAVSEHDYLLHLGSDIVRFSDGDEGSVRVGAMGLFGSSSSTAKNGSLSARTDLNGYNAGLYSTWYGHQDILSGPYVDAWAMYGSYHNHVKGEGLASESYRSKTLTGSLEGGYSFKVRDTENAQTYLEPQAQIIAQRYKAPEHIESTGTTVSQLSNSALTTRLGIRLHSNISDDNHQSMLRPYSEINWWHGDSSQQARFNNDPVWDKLPADRLELKLGLQGNVTKDTSVWGSIAGETGAEHYRSGELQLGVKYSW